MGRFDCTECNSTIAITKPEVKLTIGKRPMYEDFELPQGHGEYDIMNCRECGADQFKQFFQTVNWKSFNEGEKP